MRTRQSDHSSNRGGSPANWVYWGASGILQPLSDEFLYRSPTRALRATGICRLLGGREVDSAVR